MLEEERYATIVNYTRGFARNIRHRLALAVAIAVGPIAGRYTHRTRKLQRSFAVNDRLVDLDRAVLDRMVDA